jgi:hypothetical protein
MMKKKYSTGGELIGFGTQALGLISGVGAIAPVIGSIASIALDTINKKKQKSQAVSDLYSNIQVMENGGMLNGRADASYYKGKKHREGGIMVNNSGIPDKKSASAEVEGGEVRFQVGDQTYIFSDKLVIK